MYRGCAVATEASPGGRAARVSQDPACARPGAVRGRWGHALLGTGATSQRCCREAGVPGSLGQSLLRSVCSSIQSRLEVTALASFVSRVRLGFSSYVRVAAGWPLGGLCSLVPVTHVGLAA